MLPEVLYRRVTHLQFAGLSQSVLSPGEWENYLRGKVSALRTYKLITCFEIKLLRLISSRMYIELARPSAVYRTPKGE